MNPFGNVMYLAMLVALIACWRVPSDGWRLRNALLASIAWGLATEATAVLVSHFAMLNSIVYNLCVPLEFLLLLWLVHRFRPRWRGRLIAAAVLGCLAMLVAGFLQDPMQFILVEPILVISGIMTIVLLAALWSLANTSEVPLQKVPEFWLFTGLLIYFGGMVPFIGMVRFVFHQDAVLASKLAIVMPLLGISRYGFITAACLMQARRTRSLRHG